MKLGCVLVVSAFLLLPSGLYADGVGETHITIHSLDAVPDGSNELQDDAKVHEKQGAKKKRKAALRRLEERLRFVERENFLFALNRKGFDAQGKFPIGGQKIEWRTTVAPSEEGVKVRQLFTVKSKGKPWEGTLKFVVSGERQAVAFGNEIELSPRSTFLIVEPFYDDRKGGGLKIVLKARL